MMRHWLLAAVLVFGCDDTLDAGTDMGSAGGAGGQGGVAGGGGLGGMGGGLGGMGGSPGGTGGGPGGMGGMGGQGGMPPPTARLAECGYVERYLAADAVSDGQGCRAPGPANDALVTLDHDTNIMRFGDIAASIVDVGDDCVIRAVTCTADAAAGDFDTLTIRLDGASLRVERERIVSNTALECGTATARLTALEACQIDGRYAVDAGERTDGLCDHPWGAGQVQIGDVGDNGGRRIRWLETDADVFRFSALIDEMVELECGVEGGGTFNIDGATRRQTVRAEADGDDLMLIMTESQDGVDDNGLMCPEASFMAIGRRVVPSAEPGPTDCGSPDSVCGDGVCTAGAEDCRNCEMDCGCGDGTCGRVGERWMCGAPCMDGQCPPGQRCLVEFPAFEGPTCLPDDGRVAPGGECASSLDCGTGFVCSCTINWNCPGGSVCVEACNDGCDRCETRQWGTEICERDCGPENPECSDGTQCVTRSTNTGCTRAMGVDPWVCYPRETAHACEAGAPPAFGEICGNGRRCALGLECVGTTCEQMEEGVGCEVYQCSRGCDDENDCEAPLSECWRVENRDFGYCIPPQD